MTAYWNPACSRYLLCTTVMALAVGTRPLTAQESHTATLTAEVDALFANLDTPESPGCVLGIIQGGRFLYERGYGMASLEDSVPLSAATTIYIASVVKQFVAASVLLAAEQGYLSLDEDIRTYLPEMPEYESPITIRHLIHHTSGVRDMYTLTSLLNMEFEAPTEEEALSLLARQKELNFKPGTRWAYATSNYELLGHIVGRATGTPLWAFAEANLFAPLGMTNTHIHHGAHHGAVGYVRTEGGGFHPAKVGSRRGAYTTLEDFLLWDRNLCQPALGGADFVRQLVTPGTLENGEEHDYPFGLVVGEYKGLRTVAHGGAFRGFRAAYLRFPEQEFSVLCFCNNTGVRAVELASQVADIYLEGQFQVDEPEVVDFAEGELKGFAGTYLSPTGQVLTLAVTDGSLAIVGPRGTNRLVPLSRTRFRSSRFGNNEVQFYREGPDSLWRFEVLLPVAGIMPSPSLSFRAVELVSPTAVELEEYVGEYESDEVSAAFTIVLEEANLMLERGGDLPRMLLRPTAEDMFSLEGRGATLEFVRDDQGRVTGFGLQGGGIWDLRFSKKE